jgi:putative ABC transport system substrate-binding protein
MSSEFSVDAKFLELLKGIAPTITRVAFLRDANQNAAAAGQFAVIQAMAPLLKVVEVNPVNAQASEIQTAVAAFARAPNGGLIVPLSPAVRLNRDLIIALAARHKLPAVYGERHFAAAGGNRKRLRHGLCNFGPTARSSACDQH